MSTEKIKSVTEIARYKVNENVWCLRYRNEYGEQLYDWVDMNGDNHIIEWDFERLDDLHPKDNFKLFGKKHWPKGMPLPKLPARDFITLVKLLTSNLYIVHFEVRKIKRSTKTGEFYYKGRKSPWMPESCLFDTEQAARLEAEYQSKIIKKWLD